MIKVGIWGYGGIATIHRRAYATLEEAGIPVKLVSLCDIRSEQFKREIKINISDDNAKPLPKIEKCYTDIDEMMANEELDMIDICLPAYLHKEAAIKALGKGYHVLCEKPMSLSFEDCNAIIDAAKAANRKAIIGQCLRFNPYYQYAKEAVASKKYGKVLNASFWRLSQAPIWGWNNWYMDVKRSGGVNFDLHIHDIDSINYIFGVPDKVSCFNTENNKLSGRDTAFTTLVYGDGTIVNARADWGLPQKFRFDYGFRIDFEDAAIELKNEKLYLITDEVNEEIPIVMEEHQIASEIRYFIDCIANDRSTERAALESTAASIKIEECMLKSAAAGGQPVEVCK